MDPVVLGPITERRDGSRDGLAKKARAGIDAVIIEASQIPSAKEIAEPKTKGGVGQCVRRDSLVSNIEGETGRGVLRKRQEIASRFADPVVTHVGNPDGLGVEIAAKVLGARGPLRDPQIIQVGKNQLS